jgi:hypothetical protein
LAGAAVDGGRGDGARLGRCLDRAEPSASGIRGSGCRLRDGFTCCGAIPGRSGSRVLVLIICGGEFDQDTGSYDENVVVTAEPVG